MSDKKVTNKYSINEEVWFMWENKPKTGLIVNIDLENEVDINYCVNNTSELYNQDEVFKTKQELLDSL